jgi:hypothetical protein
MHIILASGYVELPPDALGDVERLCRSHRSNWQVQFDEPQENIKHARPRQRAIAGLRGLS